MSNSCSALATKPEVKKLQSEVSTKIDNSEKPKIIKEASAIALPLAIAATLPEARKALKIATQALKLAKTLAGKILSIFDKISGILSLVGLLATQAQLLLLQTQFLRLQRRVFALDKEVGEANFRASLAIASANAATSLANATNKKANAAIKKANKAIASADLAYGNSISASRDAKLAITAANKAIASADLATAKANLATTKSNFALLKGERAEVSANAATDKANKAIALSNANAKELATLRQENSRLRGDLELTRSDLNGFRVGLTTLASRLNSTNQEINKKEDKFIVRRVKEQTVINSTGITGLNGSVIGLEPKILSKSNEYTKTLVQRYTQTLLGSGGTIFKGIENKLEKRIKVGDTGLSEKQVREIATTEVKTVITGVKQVNQKQADDLKKAIEGIPSITLGLVGAGLATQNKTITNGFRQVINQTSLPSLTRAASAGVCNSSRPGGCLNNNISDAVRNNMSGLINAGGTAFAAANNALLLRMQSTLNVVKKATDVIKGTTNATLGVVSHASHGLQAVQNFASTAWKATKADKILGVVNTTLLVHNGMMLSNNLASTVSEALNTGLQALGIRDETDSPIDIGASVGSKVQAMLTSIVGAENYAALTTRIAKANRIYQAGVNILQTTQELFDSARTITELAAENTGQIGNALLEAGVVYEDAYREMLDEVNETTTAMHKLDKFRAGIEVAEEGLSLITEVSSEIIDIKDNVQQLREDKTAWREEVEAKIVEKETETAETKEASKVTADISELDFDREESN